nr:hypothetical protein [Tanacetum cinerariifolium]
ARLAADGAVVRPPIMGLAAGSQRWWGGREARPAAYSQAAEGGGGSEASRCEAGGGKAGAAVGEAPWAGPAGRRGRYVMRRPHDDEGVARPARVWCRGAGGGGRQVRVVGWGGRAGDEAGGRADSWRPAMVGRQGGEAGRLGRGWRGGGDRLVRVVGPGTWPVGP